MTRAMKLLIVAFSLLVATSADARPRHAKRHLVAATQPSCFIYPNDPTSQGCAPGGAATSSNAYNGAGRASREGEGKVLGGRPHGCPGRFCGCEASLYLFGRIIPELNLAANWFKFPSASPGAKMAAVRNGHVMILISQVSGDNWLVHDGNSGGGLTREHIRSIAGYRIVDPGTGSFRTAVR